MRPVQVPLTLPLCVCFVVSAGRRLRYQPAWRLVRAPSLKTRLKHAHVANHAHPSSPCALCVSQGLSEVTHAPPQAKRLFSPARRVARYRGTTYTPPPLLSLTPLPYSRVPLPVPVRLIYRPWREAGKYQIALKTHSKPKILPVRQTASRSLARSRGKQR